METFSLPLLCDDTQLTTGVITANLSSRLPLTIWPVLVIHGNHRVTAATASFANGSFMFPKGGSGCYQCSSAESSYLPPECKAHFRDFFCVSAAPGDSCSGVLFPKSCGRHCVSVWDVYVQQSTTWQFLHRGDAQRDWGRIWTQASNATILWGSTLLDADLRSSCHNCGSSIALSAPFILLRISAKGQGAIISIHSRKTKADRWPG